jgi:hypothetical protein
MPEPSSASPHYHIQAEFERDGKPVTGHFVGKFLNSKYEWAPFVLGSETDLELQRASKSKERYFEQLFDKVRLFWLHRSDGKKSKHFLKPGEVDRSSGFRKFLSLYRPRLYLPPFLLTAALSVVTSSAWQLQRKYGTLVNHLQGEWMLARKDLLAALLYKAYGKEAWHLHPQTCTLHASADKSFEIADDVLSMLSPSSQAGCADGSAGDTDLAGTDLFILKPSGGSCGVGIRVARLSTASQLHALLAEHYSDFATVVFQRYVDKPLLFEGHKFDIRVNMLVLSVEPLVVYSHRGHIRLCGLPYDLENVEDLSRHLTNTHIQRFVPDMPHDEENDAVNGFKIRRDWASFGSMLEQNGMHLNDAEAAMNENMAKVMEAVRNIVALLFKRKYSALPASN